MDVLNTITNGKNKMHTTPLLNNQNQEKRNIANLFNQKI